jgi:2-amino-4-hydroxy-6-hydroxymethyldihydropteridine diphosphokinase
VTKLDISENQANIILIAIGSNLGNRKMNIEKAKFFLNQNKVKFISVSKYYETPSWPDPKKPKFLNIVLKASCNLNPIDLLKICKLIEIKLGRKKDKKNSPRTCDIDIIDFNGMTSNKLINLPHKLMHKRNFVLFPLFEIDKRWLHPILNTDIKTLIFSLSIKEIRSIKQI